MSWGSKTTLTTATQSQWGPYRATNGDYYLFELSGTTLQAYSSTTITGTYSTAGSSQSTGLGNDSTHEDIAGAWSTADNEMHFVVLDDYSGGTSGRLADIHGIRFDPSDDSWSTAAISTAAEIDIGFNYGIDIGYDEAEGRAYFGMTGDAELVSSTLRRRYYAARWNGSSWDWFSAGDTGTTTVESPQGMFSGATRAYAMSGTSSANSVYALDGGSRSSSSETTQQDHLKEGPGAVFDGSTFGVSSETEGAIIQRTEGDPPGSPSSKTPSGWGSSESPPNGWMLRVYDGTLYGVAYNATDDDLSYSTLGSAAGTWAAATDIDTSLSTFDSPRLLLVDTDDDGTDDTIWIVFDDGTNTAYYEWTDPLVTLVLADADHAHTVDAGTLTQTHELASADTDHAHTADGSDLTQTHVIDGADTDHGHSADGSDLTQTHVLASQDADHAHAADTSDPVQTHVLASDDSDHGHSADNATLTVQYNVPGDDADHAHTVGNATLVQTHVLAVQDANHAHTVDVAGLVQTHTMVLADSDHAHTADASTLTHTHVLVSASAAHAHTVDVSAIIQTHLLGLNDTDHAHSVDAGSLTQTHVLGIDDADHAHAADNVTLISGPFLLAQSADHAHTADVVSLTQTHVLVLQDATHGHTADSTTVDDGTAPPPFSSIFVPMLIRRRR